MYTLSLSKSLDKPLSRTRDFWKALRLHAFGEAYIGQDLDHAKFAPDFGLLWPNDVESCILMEEDTVAMAFVSINRMGWMVAVARAILARPSRS